VIITSNFNVTSSKLYTSNNTFSPDGLFSEVIFGNTKSFTCHCGKTHSVDKFGTRCPDCNVLLGPSSLRRYVVSRIEFPFKIVHPLLALYRLPYTLLNKLRKESVLTTNTYEEIEQYLINTYDPKINIPLYTQELIVLPPTVRPVSKVDKSNMNLDKLNYVYLNILTLLEKFVTISEYPDNLLTQVKQTTLNLTIQAYEYIIQHMTKKEGIIRKFVLGKRNDFTGRTVITVDPRLKIDEVRVPYPIFVAGYFPQILHELAKTYNYITAYNYLNQYMNYPDSLPLNVVLEIDDIIERISSDKVVLLNRQPTLHRNSILGFKPILSKKLSLSIPMQVCNPFNADFDGDTMAIYFPQTDKAVSEAKEKMLSSKNLLLAGSLQYNAFTQDLVLGIWFATSEEGDKDKVIEIKDIKELSALRLGTYVNYKGVINTAGRTYVSDILKVNIVKPLGKKQLYNYLTQLIQEGTPDIVDRLDKLQKFALQYLPFSISILDFTSKEDWKQSFEDTRWTQSKIVHLVEETQNQRNILPLTNNISGMIHSGARGSIGQWSQCTLLRGFVRNTVGKLILPPVMSSLIEGYNPTEIIISSAGNRKGLVDKALNTATSGYLTRKLVYSLQHIRSSEIDDCGTTEGITITLTESNIEKYLFRYTTDGQFIDRKNQKEFIGKTVVLRSPIYCKAKDGICKKCHSIQKYYNSRNIGFISAQAMGEPGTQLVMRSFHTGGSADIKLLDVPEVLLLTDDNSYVTTQDIEIQLEDTENFQYDLDNKLLRDTNIIISWGSDQQSIVMLPALTKLLVNPNNFVGLHKAGTPLFVVEMSVVDLATDLTYVSSLLGKKLTLSYKEALDSMQKLEDLYWGYQSIHSLHFELLYSERLRDVNGAYLRLKENVAPDELVILESISNIAHSRMLLSLCFENFRKFFNTYLETTQGELSPIEKLISNVDSLK